jgi:hypothetical protein
LLTIAGLAAVLGLMSAMVARDESAGTQAAARVDAGEVPDHVTIRLRAVGDSEVTGKATLRASDGITTVAIRLTDNGRVYPAQIHLGTCEAFEAMPGFPLADAEPGQITRTVVEITLADLLTGDYVINLHRPSTDLASLLDPASVVACGAIAQPKPSATGTAVAIQPPVTGVGSALGEEPFGALAVGLLGLAIVLGIAGMVVRRSDRRLSPPDAT